MTSSLHRRRKAKTPTWPVQDAKARFSELLKASIEDGPQIVTKRGVQTAIVVRIDEWRRLCASARPSLKDLLVSDVARAEIPIPPRGRRRRRRLTGFSSG